MNRRLAAIALAVVVVAAAAWLVLRPSRAERHPAARTVDRLLDTRATRSADASAYAPFFKEPFIARQLAEDDSRTSEARPVPRWRRPYLSALPKGTAEVVVLWRSDPAFRDWPRATLFVLSRSDSRWVVLDAQPLAGEPPPPAALSD